MADVTETVGTDASDIGIEEIVETGTYDTGCTDAMFATDGIEAAGRLDSDESEASEGAEGACATYMTGTCTCAAVDWGSNAAAIDGTLAAVEIPDCDEAPGFVGTTITV